MLIFHLFN